MTKWRHPICSDCISYLTRKRNFMWATVLQIKPLLYVILHGTLKHQQIPHFKVPSEVFTYYKNWFPICLFIQDNSFSSATLLSALQCIQCSTPPVLEQAQALGVQSLLKCCEKPIPKFDTVTNRWAWSNEIWRPTTAITHCLTPSVTLSCFVLPHCNIAAIFLSKLIHVEAVLLGLKCPNKTKVLALGHRIGESPLLPKLSDINLKISIQPSHPLDHFALHLSCKNESSNLSLRFQEWKAGIRSARSP